MSKRDDAVYLRHILDSITRVRRHVAGMDADEFEADEKTQDAVVRQLEIIGEAARNVSQGFREAHPAIPWMDMIGMRNRLIHEYFNVSLDIAWDTVQLDLPSLGLGIEAVLAELEET